MPQLFTVDSSAPSSVTSLYLYCCFMTRIGVVACFIPFYIGSYYYNKSLIYDDQLP